MIETKLSTFNPSRDLDEIDIDTYDAFGEASIDEKDSEESAETFGYIGNPESLVPRSTVSSPSLKTSHENIADLFTDMPSFKQHFLRILEFCKKPKESKQLDAFVSDLHIERRAVYSAASYCQMLESVGALTKSTGDGTPYDQISTAPVRIVRNGQVFIKPGTPPQAYWQTSAAGSLILEEVSPLETLQAIFEKQSKYQSIFIEILELCNDIDGASIDQIKQAVNHNPVLEYPAKTAQFFMEYLNQHGALIWDTCWKTTDIGRQALALLKQKGACND